MQDWTRPLCEEFDFIYITPDPKTSNFEFTVYSGFHSADWVGVESKTARPEFGLSYSVPLSTIKKAGYPKFIIEMDYCLYIEAHSPPAEIRRARDVKPVLYGSTNANLDDPSCRWL